jgi:hypothetical protein
MMHEPASEAATHIFLWRLEEHELLLDSFRWRAKIIHLPIPSHENDLIVLAVGISGYTLLLRPTLFLLPISNELSHLALKIHEQAFRTAGALKLLAQLLGHDAGSRRFVGYSLCRGFLRYGGGLALVGLALEACVPEGSEVVRDVLGLPGWVDFPVLGERRFGVRVVQEVIWLDINTRFFQELLPGGEGGAMCKASLRERGGVNPPRTILPPLPAP